MKVLVTGANGYIGSRLIPLLIEKGYKVAALVRSSTKSFLPEPIKNRVEIIVGDLEKPETLIMIPKDICAAYYLIHSMSSSTKNFFELEQKCIENFLSSLQGTQIKQIIYLSGLFNTENPSPHFASRINVENILKKSHFKSTIIRASIIVGSGSASFEMMRDLVEKLPIMVAPKWVQNRCQPIAVQDVMYYLMSVLGNKECFGKIFEVGGPEILSYHNMLLKFAEFRHLKRIIINVPVLTPKLSSYWLYFVTSTTFSLAQALVESLKCESICRDVSIQKIIPHKCLGFQEAVSRAFNLINENMVVSSGMDAIRASRLNPDLFQYFEVPKYGCLKEKIEISFKGDSKSVVDKIFSIGGKNGWYYMNWAWNLRGFIDKLIGGIGLQRGRKDPVNLNTGDVLDFWRVLLADREKGRLLLYAEMKVPGEAWLEFHVKQNSYIQIATFRPRGVLGRLYWYFLYPVHHMIFLGMARVITQI